MMHVPGNGLGKRRNFPTVPKFTLHDGLRRYHFAFQTSQLPVHEKIITPITPQRALMDVWMGVRMDA